ncbi:phage integrase SAM-like domain-containing protein [Mucilaginibacter sp. FT3.2]|uniref:phage integrase SAM-like domain-containing protein n=1 Tax=Mucilaginibacter sp. FT3.2 TaxID=2723090 RepID=UPI0016191571|nr:phage integrase SAM-like domain-containing protein [Mucilaginibacter sp. FT3.2]MBB6231241.1 integrase [Mucilaginibacter sp. FT3.2]
MATVREVVLPHQGKKDGTWNVKIRVSHKRISSYIDTIHFIGAKQLRKDFTIKDSFIIDLINPTLKEYRDKISELGLKLDYYNSKSLAHYLESGGQVRAEDINVIAFGWQQVERLVQAERDASAADMRKVLYSLMDYFKSEVVPITEIRAKFLKDYETYLKEPRVLTRPDQFKGLVTKKVKGLQRTGLHNHMRDLRILFNNIKDFYNDEDLGIEVVKHYPFKKYKIVKPSKNTKAKLTINQVRAILNCEVPQNSRIELARDLSMLSFFLCGMNAADLYRLPPAEENMKDRIDYNRKKTMTRRDDEAFMSVYIPDIAIALYRKYAGNLQKRYGTAQALDQAISKGMVGLRKLTKTADLGFYDLRHAFADIARNVLHFDKDDVAEALNHVNPVNNVTDTYLARSWEIIDAIQSEIIDYLIYNRKSKFKKKLTA